MFSQITFTKGSRHTSNIIPYGQADLLLGIDPLEATRSLSPTGNLRVGSPGRTVAVVNAYKTPTILTLLGKDDFSVAELEDTLRRYTRSDEYFGLNVAGISEHFFGTKLYANVVLLGIAFQRGLLPLSLENIEWGLRPRQSPLAGTAGRFGLPGPGNRSWGARRNHYARPQRGQAEQQEPEVWRQHGGDCAREYRESATGAGDLKKQGRRD